MGSDRWLHRLEGWIVGVAVTGVLTGSGGWLVVFMVASSLSVATFIVWHRLGEASNGK